jgi:dGTPase
MDSLEDRQREMRERNLAKKTTRVISEPRVQIDDTPEALKKRIAVLEKRLLELQTENQRLRQEKTVVIERPQPQKSYDEELREQRHNFFKYRRVIMRNPWGLPSKIRVCVQMTFELVSLQWFHDQYGLNLTISLLAAYLKYLGEQPESEKFRKKVGYFPSERKLVEEIWKALNLKTDTKGSPAQRHPLAFVMEAADDISYCLSDIEDAIEQGVVSEDLFLSWIKSNGISVTGVKRQSEKYKKSRKKEDALTKNGTFHIFRIKYSGDLVNRAVESYLEYEDQILNGKMKTSLLGADSTATKLLDLLKAFSAAHVYTSREAIESELGGLNAIKGLLDAYKPMLQLTTDEFKRLREPGSIERLRKYPTLALLASLLPNKHVTAYEWFAAKDVDLEPLYRTQLVVDYIAGMTDSHVLKIFNIVNGTQQFGIE